MVQGYRASNEVLQRSSEIEEIKISLKKQKIFHFPILLKYGKLGYRFHIACTFVIWIFLSIHLMFVLVYIAKYVFHFSFPWFTEFGLCIFYVLALAYFCVFRLTIDFIIWLKKKQHEREIKDIRTNIFAKRTQKRKMMQKKEREDDHYEQERK